MTSIYQLFRKNNTAAEYCDDAYEITSEDIRKKAYELWETAGSPDSDGVEFWLKAEELLNSRIECSQIEK